jgi:hypothetical protein
MRHWLIEQKHKRVMEEEEIPKTKTESAGGGRPPGKTRIGASESGPPYKPNFEIWLLERDAWQILDAMERELGKDKWDIDQRELSLLKELLAMVIAEINGNSPNGQVQAVLERLNLRCERREDLKEFLKNEP